MKILSATDKIKTTHLQSAWVLRNYQIDLEKRLGQFVFRAYRDKPEAKLKNDKGQYVGAYFDTYSFDLKNSEFDAFYLETQPVSKGGEGKDMEKTITKYAMTRQDKEIDDPQNPGQKIKVAFFLNSTDDPEL